jgi:hypothetical protein
LHPATRAALEEEYRKLVENPPQVRHLVTGHDPCHPKLHHKTQFFANSTALELFKKRDLSLGVHAYFQARKDDASGVREPHTGITPRLLPPSPEAEHPFNQAAHGASPASAAAPDVEGPIMAWTIGSHNQDRRSFMLDGEALVLVTGEDALISVIDFAMIIGSAHWVESLEELQSMYPRSQSLWRRVASWIKDLI